MRLMKSKKGFNDMSIITLILIILFGTAFLIPSAGAATGDGATSFDTDNVADNVRTNSENANQFNIFTVLFNVLKLSLWDVGDSLGLPWFLDLTFTVMAVILVLTIARNIWIGGGS